MTRAEGAELRDTRRGNVRLIVSDILPFEHAFTLGPVIADADEGRLEWELS